MAEIQARALYDFAGDVANGELSFYCDEILTITNQSIGDGWWEATNSMGSSGFIPESYVEITSLPEPSFPPPPAPSNNIRASAATNHFNGPSYGNERSSSHNTSPNQTFNYEPASTEGPGFRQSVINQPINETSSNRNAQHVPLTNQESEGWDDDDWDDDDDSSTTDQDIQYRNSMTTSRAANPRPPSPGGDQLKYGTVKRSFSRFSTFAKSGGEAYLLGQVNIIASVSETDVIKIIDSVDGKDSVDGPMWEPSQHPFTGIIAEPHKESKLKGLKSFITYQVTPSYTHTQVSRRYKHFDWLHQRLEEKFVCIPIAPLPEKAISGRYEEDFITERMRLLQLWMNRIVRHPVLSQCDVLNHFLNCTDDKKTWKQGKRRAEKDEYMSAKFFLTVQTPPQPLEIKRVEDTTENFSKFVRGMDDGLKHLIMVVHDNMKRHYGPFKREYEKLGNAFKGLATSFQVDTNLYSSPLTHAMQHTADTYNTIGALFENQPRNDSLPLLAGLYEYKGLLYNYPDVLKIEEGALMKARECLKQQEEGKLSESDVQNVVQRADVISYCTIAEMKHFQHERVSDFSRMMKHYLREQIDFYKQITNKLEETLREYDKT